MSTESVMTKINRSLISMGIEQRITDHLLPEALKKIRNLKVNTKTDRVRIVFEFEFNNGVIRDAVEIRHRRPWKEGS